MTSRQKSLYLSAKLYELAAEFTDSELEAILSTQNGVDESTAIAMAITALIRLHAELEASGPIARKQIALRPNQPLKPPLDRAPSRQSSSLAALFDDRSTFPTVSDIAKTLHVEVRPKESRDRYLARVTRLVEMMSAYERSKFFDELTTRLNHHPDNFISKWSKLIKEL